MSDGTVRGCVYGAARVLSESGEAEDTPELRAALEALYVAHRSERPRDWHLRLLDLWREGGTLAGVQGELF